MLPDRSLDHGTRNETTIRVAQSNEFEIGQARHEIDELFWSDFA